MESARSAQKSARVNALGGGSNSSNETPNSFAVVMDRDDNIVGTWPAFKSRIPRARDLIWDPPIPSSIFADDG